MAGNPFLARITLPLKPPPTRMSLVSLYGPLRYVRKLERGVLTLGSSADRSLPNNFEWQRPSGT
jgi:hypothetical protein